MDAGKIVYIRYAGHPLWHARLLLARVGSSNSRWIIVTPDRDSYLEDFSITNQDIEELRFPLASGAVPGAARDETYRFRQVPEGLELAELIPLPAYVLHHVPLSLRELG